MKTNGFLRKTLFNSLAVTLLAGTLMFTSCEDEDVSNDDEVYTLSGNASGSQMSPAVTTSATGTITGTYNARTNLLQYDVNWTGLAGAASHVYFNGPAMAGANAGVIHDVAISTNGISGRSNGSITIADSTEAHLLAGKMYYTVTNALNASGEVRGQIVTTNN